MVIAHDIQKWLDKRRKKQLEAAREEGIELGEERGMERGRSQERSLWEEWNARRLEAESRGEDFREPPPNGKIG